MNSRPIGRWLCLIITVLAAVGLFLSNFQALAAANRLYYYDSINVDIKILRNSDLQVSETQAFVFTSGDFHYGFRWIPTDRLESVDNVEVLEGDRKYPLNPSVKEWIEVRKETGKSPGGETYAYATWREGDKFWIGWWFPETRNSTRNIELRYTVHGGLRINSPADQLYWKAIFGDRDSYVGSSKVVVHLPRPVLSQQLFIYSYGVPATTNIVDDQTVEFLTGRIPADEELEVGVYFPHGFVEGSPPAWQIRLERQEAYNAEVKPVINLSLTLFGLVAVPLLGSLWIRRAFKRRGRLPRIESVPQLQYSPPSDLPPALVGILTRAKVGPAELTATIFHLASKGILEIVQTEKQRWFGSQKDVLVIKAKDGEKFSFEKLVTQALASREGKLLSEQKGRLPQLVKEFKQKVERDAIKQGLFEEEPSRSIRRLQSPGLLIVFFAMFLGIPLFIFLGQYAEMIFVPFLTLIFIGIAAIILSSRLPKRTETGATESAQWECFGRYLKKMVKDKQLATDNLSYWDSYFSYAVVFSLAQGWVKQFSELEAPTPVWFYIATDTGRGITPGTVTAVSSVPSLSSIGNAFSGMVNMVQGSFSGGSGSGGGGGGGGGGAG
jgi:uncharacterized membrane protein